MIWRRRTCQEGGQILLGGGVNVSACVADLGGRKFGKECQGEKVNIGWMTGSGWDAGAGGVITTANDMVSPLIRTQ